MEKAIGIVQYFKADGLASGGMDGAVKADCNLSAGSFLNAERSGASAYDR